MHLQVSLRFLMRDWSLLSERLFEGDTDRDDLSTVVTESLKWQVVGVMVFKETKLPSSSWTEREYSIVATSHSVPIGRSADDLLLISHIISMVCIAAIALTLFHPGFSFDQLAKVCRIPQPPSFVLLGLTLNCVGS